MLKDFKAFEMSKKLYWECKRVRLPDYLKKQLLRASSSVALNIAEGSGKRTPEDQGRFYGMALGSLRECQAVFALEKIESGEAISIADNLGAILYRLSRPNKPLKQTSQRSSH